METGKTVICLIGQLGTGGSEKQLYLFLKHLERTKINPIVIVSSSLGSNKWEDNIRALSIPVVFLKSKLRLSKLLEFKSLVSKHKPDMIFSWSFHTNAYYWVCPGSIKFIGSLRNELAMTYKESSFLHVTSSLHVPRLIVNSSLLREELLKKGIDGRKICVVHNILESGEDNSYGESLDIRTKNNIPENAILVAGIGRNALQKDFNFFIDVFAKASAANSRLHGLILGSGGTAMLGKIKKLGLEDKFTVLGEVKSVMPFLKASDIFFLSSRHEGMPNVVLEALMAGCSILTTNVGGCTDIFDGCSKGVLEKILLDDRNPDTAAAKLLHLTENNSVRDYLKTNHRSFISKFSYETVMPEYYKALGLENIIDSKIPE